LTLSDKLRNLEVESFGFPTANDRGVPASGIVRGGIAGGCAIIEATKIYGHFTTNGFSGSPVWVEGSRMTGVVGMVVSAEEEKRTAYIIPTALLIRFLNRRPDLRYRIRPALTNVDPPPADFLPRPKEFALLLKFLLDTDRKNPIAITTALKGAGGYGKTTLARAACHDSRVILAFPGGILSVTLGKEPGDLTGRVLDLIEYIE